MMILSLIIKYIRSNSVVIPYRIEHTPPDLSLIPFDGHSQFLVRNNSRCCCFVENFLNDDQVERFIVNGSTAVVVALVLRIESLFGKRRCKGEEQW